MSDSSSTFEPPRFSTAASDDESFEDDDEFEADDEVDDDVDEDVDDSDGELDEADGEADHDEANLVSRGSDAEVDGGTARAVLEHVARSIVDDPEAVLVDVAEQRGALRLSLHVSPSDMGRIIGRRGRVAQALRSLVRAAAAKDGTDASVDIVD